MSAPHGSGRVCELLGCTIPILSAPMGGSAKSALVAAVSGSGAFGLLGCGFVADVDELQTDYIEPTEAALCGGAPFGLGFVDWKIDTVGVFDHAVKLGYPILITNFHSEVDVGVLKPYTDRAKSAGVVLLFQVQTLQQAIVCEQQLSADIVVVQCEGAGGHCTNKTMAMKDIIPQCVAKLSIPVVAAGGIVDGADIAHAMFDFGAEGVLIGTRFCLSEEINFPNEYKKHLCSGTQTIATPLFDMMQVPCVWPSGTQARALSTEFTSRFHSLMTEESHMEEAREIYSKDKSDYAVRAVWAGSGIARINQVLPAADIVSSLWNQAQMLKK